MSSGLIGKWSTVRNSHQIAVIVDLTWAEISLRDRRPWFAPCCLMQRTHFAAVATYSFSIFCRALLPRHWFVIREAKPRLRQNIRTFNERTFSDARHFRWRKILWLYRVGKQIVRKFTRDNFRTSAIISHTSIDRTYCDFVCLLVG